MVNHVFKFLGFLQRTGGVTSTNGATKAYDGFLGKNPANTEVLHMDTPNRTSGKLCHSNMKMLQALEGHMIGSVPHA